MEASLSGESGEQLKLMVVDDEADNLDLLYRTFRRDYIVFKAESGMKALEILAREGEMGIIISDQRMPKMNGTEFLSHTVDQFPDTIRILLTGYTDVEDLVGAINAGKVFKYITKPWNSADLRKVVQQAGETYRIVKQRTNELNHALKRESIFNAVMTAIRESLDYRSMLQTVVDTVGRTFAADFGILYPIEFYDAARPFPWKVAAEIFSYPIALVPGTAKLPTFHSLTDAQLPFIPLSPRQLSVYSTVTHPATDCLAPTVPLPEKRTGGETGLPTLPSVEAIRSAFTSGQVQLLPATEALPCVQLIVPLTYQQEALAVLMLYKHGGMDDWDDQTLTWSTEDLLLIQGVAEQASLAISQAKLYQRIQEQTEQMRLELAVARQIQMNLLRQSWSTDDNVRVQARCYPAREVGGDFFEVYVHPQGDIWLAVGDVSGKGVPAALFMASAISLLRRELSLEISPDPDVVLKNLNRSLSDDLVGSNCFITMALARYTPTTGELTYANAGHIYPMVWSHQLATVLSSAKDVPCDVPLYLKVRGVPLGILPDWTARAGNLTLKSGDVLLLTSDGITEATVPNHSTQAQGEMLQQSGLWQLLTQQQTGLDLDSLLTHIQGLNSVQEDDQTILSLEVL